MREQRPRVRAPLTFWARARAATGRYRREEQQKEGLLLVTICWEAPTQPRYDFLRGDNPNFTMLAQVEPINQIDPMHIGPDEDKTMYA